MQIFGERFKTRQDPLDLTVSLWDWAKVSVRKRPSRTWNETRAPLFWPLPSTKQRSVLGAKDLGGPSLQTEVRVRGQPHVGSGWKSQCPKEGSRYSSPQRCPKGHSLGIRKYYLPGAHGVMGSCPTRKCPLDTTPNTHTHTLSSSHTSAVS